MSLIVPDTYNKILDPIIVKTYINGVRYPNCNINRLCSSIGIRPSELEGELPYSDFNFTLEDNDLVEVEIEPYGFLFRGYIVDHSCTQTKNLRFYAIDYREKLNDANAEINYNYTDKVTKKIENIATVKEAIEDLYIQYLNTQNYLYGDSAFILTLDNTTLPDDYAKEQIIEGQPMGGAISSILGDYDKKWTFRVIHDESDSILQIFPLDVGYNVINLVYATDPNLHISQQPNGFANLKKVLWDVSTQDTISHIHGVGSNLLLETKFTLSKGWDNTLTSEEEADIINNWHLYTKQNLIDGSVNQYYNDTYKQVFTRWIIPIINDTWINPLSDPENQTYLGLANRQVPIEHKCIQTKDDGSEVKPFLVYKKLDDTNIYFQDHGFTITDNQYIEMTTPFVEDVKCEVVHGDDGKFISYNSTDHTSIYHSDLSDFTAKGNLIDTTNPSYIKFGDWQQEYKILGIPNSHELRIQGDLSGYGIVDGQGKTAAGNHFQVILKRSPIIDCGTQGSGGSIGKYTTGRTTYRENEFVGKYLVLGEFNVNTDSWEPKYNLLGSHKDEYKYHRIIGNTSTGIISISDKTNLTGVSAFWKIVAPKTEFKRPYEWVVLNTAFESLRKLEYFSDDLNELNVKKMVTVKNTDYKWNAQYNNYVFYVDEQDNNKLKVKLNLDGQSQPVWVDTLNQSEELELWADNEKSGELDAKNIIEGELPFFDLNIRVGDKLFLNGNDTGCSFVRLDYDFHKKSIRFRASNRVDA